MTLNALILLNEHDVMACYSNTRPPNAVVVLHQRSSITIRRHVENLRSLKKGRPRGHDVNKSYSIQRHYENTVATCRPNWQPTFTHIIHKFGRQAVNINKVFGCRSAWFLGRDSANNISCSSSGGNNLLGNDTYSNARAVASRLPDSTCIASGSRSH